MSLRYEDAGVDISEGNRAVELMKKSVKSTYNDQVLGDIGLFAGAFSLEEAKGMENPILLASTDGVGTKLMIAQEMGIHNTVGVDLVAMCVNDLICQGAKPILFLDYVATGRVEAEKIAEIVEGIAEGCRQSGCALIGGETAEMPGMYGEEEYDLAGFSIGLCDQKDIIDGSTIEANDKVIGIHSNGFHSNGYSLARKIFFEHLGLAPEDEIEGIDGPVGERLLRPTRIYVETIQKILKKYTVQGICNITGGGLLENIPRILPEGMEVRIQKDSWDKGDLFSYIEREKIVEEQDLYRTFNMGIGMVLIVKPDVAANVVDFINHHTEDSATLIGEIAQGDGQCHILD